MYESKILLMADLIEFPYAQHYAECFSLLFADLGSRLERNATTPARHDYYKVYIAVKDQDGWCCGTTLRTTHRLERWNRGWLFVPPKGRWVKIKKYPELFEVIGTRYGGR